MDVDKLRERLKSRLRELGISAREASRRAGFNVGYVGDILDGRSKTPDADRILKLADSLDMDAADLLGDSRPDLMRTGEAMPFGEERRSGGRMLPLYAAPLPINRQFVPFGAQPAGRVPCVFMLLDVPEAFAATVPNNASAPRFFAGEIIYVNPAATPAPGNFVWVRRKDESVGIGRLTDMGAESFRLEFLGLEGAERTADVPFDDVRAIKKIEAVAF
jgi:transcriptional regulator with XRE-family HTH domain